MVGFRERNKWKRLLGSQVAHREIGGMDKNLEATRVYLGFRVLCFLEKCLLFSSLLYSNFLHSLRTTGRFRLGESLGSCPGLEKGFRV